MFSKANRANQRQVAAISCNRAGDQRHWRFSGGQPQIIVAGEVAAVNAIYCRNSGLQGFVEIAAALRLPGPQIEIGREQLVKPLIDRITERGDHDRHRRRQRNAGQHPRRGNDGMAGRGTQPGPGQTGRHRAAIRQETGDSRGERWQQHDATRQQAGYRQIAAHRQPILGGNGAGGQAGQQQAQTQPGVAVAAEQGRFVTGLQSLSRRYRGGFAGRQPRSGNPREQAERDINHHHLRLKLQRWLQAGKIPGAQITAE